MYKRQKNIALSASILIIDNYDSFTYNLLHLLSEVGAQNVAIYRNDAINLDQIAQFDKIILSPGPGLPAEAGILQAAIRHYLGKIPILGICLGLQAIAEVMGCKLKNLEQVQHGVQHKLFICDSQDPIIGNLPSPFLAGRYHSWVVNNDTIAQSTLQVSCRDANNEIMAMYNTQLAIFGLQFHPESVMTPQGKQIMAQFLAWQKS